MNLMPLAYSCSRPFYKLLAKAADGDVDAAMNWIMCPYTVTGIGLTGFGFFLILTISVGLKNWSESFVVPMVWVALASGVLVSMVPAPLANRLFGVIVGGIAFMLIGILFWLR